MFHSKYEYTFLCSFEIRIHIHASPGDAAAAGKAEMGAATTEQATVGTAAVEAAAAVKAAAAKAKREAKDLESARKRL